MPTVVDIRPEFSALVQQMQQNAAQLANVEQNGGAAIWMMPAPGIPPKNSTSNGSSSWQGDINDYTGMATLFSRDGANKQYIDIVTAKTPGSQGDAQVLQTMIDYTAMMQRAFLQRHTTSKARAFAHSAARRRGHGLDYGTFGVTVLQQLQQVVTAGKSEPQT